LNHHLEIVANLDWAALFADLNFRRHRDNEDQNLLLNYGYAVLRTT
jgi:CRISPR/Cas system-associated endonuclease Cas1